MKSLLHQPVGDDGRIEPLAISGQLLIGPLAQIMDVRPMGNLIVRECHSPNHDKGPIRPLFGQEIDEVQVDPTLDKTKKANHRSRQRYKIGGDRESVVLGLRKMVQVDPVRTDVRVPVQCQLLFQERLGSHEDDVGLARQLFVHGLDGLGVYVRKGGIIIDAIIDR